MKTKILVPRISTRGYYDLKNGITLKKNSYYLYPKKYFQNFFKKEIVIMIHGLRNDKNSAVQKFRIAKKKLRKLGYKNPIIGYTYDSNTKGAHIQKTELRALHVGEIIATKNGKNLAKFITDFKNQNPETKIRLMGHSLGTLVILSTIKQLSKKSTNQNIIESIHFFGSSLKGDEIILKKSGKVFQKIVNKKIVNCYNPGDEVLKSAHEKGQIINPLGLVGIKGRPIRKYIQKKVNPENHRFASYAAVLKSFP